MCEYSHTHKMSFFTLTPGRSLFCTWTSQNVFFLFVYENRTMGKGYNIHQLLSGQKGGNYKLQTHFIDTTMELSDRIRKPLFGVCIWTRDRERGTRT